MKINSIKQKMIISNTAVLLVLFLFLLVSFFTLSSLTHKRELEELGQQFKAKLLANGQQLVTSHAYLLRTYVGDNSYSSIQRNTQRTVQNNTDVVYGGCIRDEDFQPIVWVTPDDPTGMVEQKRVMRDDTTSWGISQDQPTHREITKNGKPYIEFVAPIRVVDDETMRLKRLATLIYGYSTDSLQLQMAETEKRFANQIWLNSLVFSILGLIAIVAGFLLTRRQATKMTFPLGVLTQASDRIAAGYYGEEVMVRSGDEIQGLASSFNKMSRDLKTTYADLFAKNKLLEEAGVKLASFNRDLENKVEQRTKQLADSESKFRTLFEESADAILVGTENEFLDCNQAMLDMLGCESKDQLRTLKPGDLHPQIQPSGEDSNEKLTEIYMRAYTQGSQFIEWTAKRLDGTEFPTEIVVTSFPLNDRMVLHKVYRDITERKETENALRLIQQRLVANAHTAGMAEIATGVLHNIGNVLNSVNISTEELTMTLKSSKIDGFRRAQEIVDQHEGDLGNFFAHHPKGKLIPGYYQTLAQALMEEHHLLKEEVRELTEKIGIMRDVISTQQSYAKASLYTEDVYITGLVEDALKLQMASLAKNGVKIKRHYVDDPQGSVAKVKLIHVLTNLIKNSREAMSGGKNASKRGVLELFVKQIGPNQMEIRICDNGSGIRPENLQKIFNHGFTTKADGHGFGLHTCANFMTEMGGSLHAESRGEGLGSTFVMRFPLTQHEVASVETETTNPSQV